MEDKSNKYPPLSFGLEVPLGRRLLREALPPPGWEEILVDEARWWSPVSVFKGLLMTLEPLVPPRPP